jgi:hypothetical protein
MTETAQQADLSGGSELNELSTRNWAVISFDRCEAASLTYREAAEKMSELESRRVAGLCLVTAETAARLRH